VPPPVLVGLLVGIGWLFAGFGMGLATASTGLAVMTLTPAADQGRDGASLNVGDALGSGLFVGLTCTGVEAVNGPAAATPDAIGSNAATATTSSGYLFVTTP